MVAAVSAASADGHCKEDKAAKVLVAEAMRRGSGDNLSALVVFF